MAWILPLRIASEREMLIVCVVFASCLVVFSALIVAARVDDLAGER